ncbi:nucleotidyltransferase family protein [Nguyenibacter vanlangensis]|uniref:nucleotidyltransferase family protein n=1 Tax=Nguyenibacter vanlangensis TaxID=1216886 RepID=UPI0035B5036B
MPSGRNCDPSPLKALFCPRFSRDGINTRWDKYEAKFGHSVTPPTSAGTATTDGLRPGRTYGLSDLLGSAVRPNKRQITREIYERKVERWTTSWIGLTVIGWNE